MVMHTQTWQRQKAGSKELSGTRCPARNVGELERLTSGLLGGGMVLWALRRGGLPGFVAGLLGGAMVQRGLTGHSATYQRLGVQSDDAEPESHPLSRWLHISAAATIARPVEEVFEFWRDPRNFDDLLIPVRSVESAGLNLWHWVCETPWGRSIEFTAQVTDEVSNSRIAWRTAEGSEVEHAGEVTFTPAPGNRGTEVRIRASYMPRGGLGRMAVRRALPIPRQDQLKRVLRSIKEYLETCEVATGVPSLTQAESKTRERAMWLSRAHGPDHIDEASKESFPASDAPAWTPGKA